MKSIFDIKGYVFQAIYSTGLVRGDYTSNDLTHYGYSSYAPTNYSSYSPYSSPSYPTSRTRRVFGAFSEDNPFSKST